jgi:hypothetical protein
MKKDHTTGAIQILKFFDADPGWEKFGSGIEKFRIGDKHPGSGTLEIDNMIRIANGITSLLLSPLDRPSFCSRHSGMEEVGVEWEQMRRLALRIELRADVATERCTMPITT